MFMIYRTHLNLAHAVILAGSTNKPSGAMRRPGSQHTSLAYLIAFFLIRSSAWVLPGRVINNDARQVALSATRLAASRSLPLMKAAASSGAADDQPEFVRVSLPKPLGVQLEEIKPGFPGLRVSGLLDGGSVKDDGVRHSGRWEQSSCATMPLH